MALSFPQSLVADNVIIVYLHLLESLTTENWHILDPVFYTNLLGPKVPYNFPECFRQSGLSKLSRDAVTFKKILFPCNTGLHWVLVIYDFDFSSILYFDSLWRRYPQINNVTSFLPTQALTGRLTRFLRDSFKHWELPFPNFEPARLPTLPKQSVSRSFPSPLVLGQQLRALFAPICPFLGSQLPGLPPC